MRPHHTQAGNVSMLHSIRRVLLHFRQDIADDPGVIVGCLFGSGDIYCDEGELGPGEGMVEVVFHEVAGEHKISFAGKEVGKGRAYFSGRLVIFAC